MNFKYYITVMLCPIIYKICWSIPYFCFLDAVLFFDKNIIGADNC